VADVVLGESKKETEAEAVTAVLPIFLPDSCPIKFFKLPAVETAIAVAPLSKVIPESPEFAVASLVVPLTLTKIKILLEALVGVIETESPVISTSEVLVVVNESVLITLTTCNTEPVGIVFVVTIVPLVVGNVSVVVPATLGASNVIVPDVLPAMTTDDII
jgi:hypothetical protein